MMPSPIDAQGFNDLLFVADREPVVEIAFRFIHQKDGKDLVGNNPVRQFRDLPEKSDPDREST